MRIGVLGGTFDPPHAAHIALAKAALTSLNLDEVMMLPAHRNPLKKTKGTPAPQRMEMLRLAIDGVENLSICDIDLVRGGPSYAVDTMTELTYAQQADYWFLVGADAVREIEKWKQPERLIRLCRLGVAIRGEGDKVQLLARIPEWVRGAIDWIEMPRMDISSTELRQRLVSGQAVQPWLSAKVTEYIGKNRLYRS